MKPSLASIHTDSRTDFVRYEAMCRAIDAAYEVDELKDIRDQAKLLEAASKLAQNTENERRACEIRLRAERKAGRILAKTEKHPGGRPTKGGDTVLPVSDAKLEDLGISKKQSADWQKLGAVPQREFAPAILENSGPCGAGRHDPCSWGITSSACGHSMRHYGTAAACGAYRWGYRVPIGPRQMRTKRQ
jgi:hypothetical protein